MKKVMYLFVFSFLLIFSFNLNDSEVQASTLDLGASQQMKTVEGVEDSKLTPGDMETQAVRTRTLESEERKNKLFVGYSSITPSWMYAPYWDISSGESHKVSGSYTYKGATVSIDFTKSYSASTRLTADANRLNRLGGYADITFKRYKVQWFENGMMFTTYETEKVIHDTYLLVVYK